MKKVIGLMKDELSEKVMIDLRCWDIAIFRPKTCSYLPDTSDENKKTENTQKCVP